MSDEVKVIGDVFPVERALTELWSFDRAVGFRGKNGITLRSIIELYGDEHTGKSTFGEYLMAKVRPDGNVHIADLEGTLDKDYVKSVMEHAGFHGDVHVANYINTDKRKSKMRSHEEQVEEVVDALLDDDVSASMVDSIGAFISLTQMKKDLGERTVGQRAKTMGDATALATAWLRIVDEPKLLIYINHTYPNIGGYGFYTPGGKKKSYLANVRIWIRRVENDIPEGTGNFLAEARIQKLKIGSAAPWRIGLVYFIPGYGVSKEMTSVFDCIGADVAKREAVIKLKKYDDKKSDFVWENMGRISEIAEKAMEPEKNKAFFQHFTDALKGTE